MANRALIEGGVRRDKRKEKVEDGGGDLVAELPGHGM